MSRHRRNARGRGVRRAAFVAGVVALVLSLVSSAWAVFTDTATVTAGTTASTAFASGTLNAPGAPAAAQTVATGDVSLSWTAATVTGGGTASTNGPTPSGYEVFRYPNETSEAGVLVCTTASAATSCSTPPQPTGTVYYGVRARFGPAWTRDSARTAYNDTRGPVLVIGQPQAQLYGSGGLRAAVNGRCNPSGTVQAALACGTVGDTAGVTGVRYQLQRTGLLSLPSCWNETSFVTGACGATFRAATLSSTAPNAAATWRIPGSPETAYVLSSLTASYVLVVEATDANGRVTTETLSFSTLL